MDNTSKILTILYVLMGNIYFFSVFIVYLFRFVLSAKIIYIIT